MTPAVLALPSTLFRLQCHLKSLSLPSSIPVIKAFSSSLALDSEETPAMKALKDIPYPSASPDPSIFESRSDEYDGLRLPRAMRAQKSIEELASPQDAKQHDRAIRVLERLSGTGKFQEAEQVRQELAEMNVRIRPSRAYCFAALNVLRQRPWPPNRAEMFANWLSLLPSITNHKKLVYFSQFMPALLFHSQHLDLKTIAQFGLIMSSKGYIRKVGATVVASLTRYADPDFSSRILDEMLAVSNDYSRSKLRAIHILTIRKAKDTTKRLWSVAVRTHCTAGRPQVALQMAKRAHEQNFRLTKFTYEFLLGKLENDGLDDLAAELRADPFCRSHDVAKNRRVLDLSNMTSIPPISRQHTIIVNQSIALAKLKRGSRLGGSACAADITPYFDIYKTDLRGDQSVNMLRSRAYRISLDAVSAVFLAEQLHHHRRGQFRHVLWVFEKFFHAVGVPLEDVKRQLWKREHYPRHLQFRRWGIPPRIKKSTFNLPSRLWPTPHHTALVWTALVHLCKSEEELFALYDSLLQHSAQFQKITVDHHHRYRHYRPSHNDSIIPAPVPAPVDKFDAAHFFPFLIAFTQLRDAKYGLRILDDLQDRGIEPSPQILGIAAALQARHGEPALALRILDIIRELIEREEADVKMKMGARSGVGVRGTKGVKNQQQLLTAYTGVLRGLIDRRDIVQARRVAELLHSHLGYVEGRGDSDDGEVDGEGDGGSSGNARTDAALRLLRLLEVKGPKVIPDSPLTDFADYYYPFLKKRDPEVRPLNFFILFSNCIIHSTVRSSYRRAPLLSP